VIQWNLKLTRQAEKAYQEMPAPAREAMRRTLDRLTRNPGSVNLKKLKGRSDLWRAASGSWRAVFQWDRAAHTIIVVDIDDRKDVFR